MSSFAPLTLPMQPSRRLHAVQALAHLLAAASIGLAQLPHWAGGLLWLAVAASFLHFRQMSQPSHLVLHDAGRFEKVGPGGTAVEAVVDAQTVVTAFLIVLVHREQGRLQALTLLPDSLSAEDARQLRLWLRWRGAVDQPA